MMWNVTGQCNYRCPMCWDPFKQINDFNTKEMLNIADEIAEKKPDAVILTGGEPLLRDDLFEIADRLYQNGVHCIKLCSNGAMLNERWTAFKNSNISEIHISFDETIHQESIVHKNVIDIAKKTNKKLVLMYLIKSTEVNGLKKVAAFARDIGAFMSYQFMVAGGSAKTAWNDGLSYDAVLKYFTKLSEFNKANKDVLELYTTTYFYLSKNYYLNNNRPDICGAGSDFMVIAPNGEQQSCYWKIRHKSHTSCKECFSAACLVWFRYTSRVRQIVNLVQITKGSR